VIEEIRNLASTQNFRLTRHAAEELADENITVDEMIDSILNGNIIEDYPNHKQGSCCLVNGTTVSGRPLHTVCTSGKPFLLIITVYEPKLPKWLTPTERRKRDEMHY
jgi:hypothetical protein